jgi:hypothetical protein
MKKRLTALAVPLMAATAIGCGEGEPRPETSVQPKVPEVTATTLGKTAMGDLKLSITDRQRIEGQTTRSVKKVMGFMQRNGERFMAGEGRFLAYTYTFDDPRTSERTTATLDVFPEDDEMGSRLSVDYRVFRECDSDCSKTLYSASADFGTDADSMWGIEPTIADVRKFMSQPDVGPQAVSKITGDNFKPGDFDPTYNFEEGSNVVSYEDVAPQQDPLSQLNDLALWKLPDQY